MPATSSSAKGTRHAASTYGTLAILLLFGSLLSSPNPLKSSCKKLAGKVADWGESCPYPPKIGGGGFMMGGISKEFGSWGGGKASMFDC